MAVRTGSPAVTIMLIMSRASGSDCSTDWARERACDANGANCAVSDAVNAVLPIELGAGWIGYIDRNLENPAAIELGENKVDENNIAVVPGSLLGRALVAQARRPTLAQPDPNSTSDTARLQTARTDDRRMTGLPW